METLVSWLNSFAPFTGVLLLVGVTLWGAHWLLIRRYADLGGERKFPRQLILLALSVIGTMVSIVALPISDSLRNQLIGLVGVLVSGILAFSSTTVISNLMAGVLLRITHPFRVGDFIRIGDHFGRVSERGLFDTEIQTETRDLIALPNTYCISHPVATIRSSGTIISASLSLGYDIDHRQVEPLLLAAAQKCGLLEPFVHIIELGNFSITYRISGFLEEPKRLLSVRSNLYASVLDTLHKEQIEIVSPTFMNQRRVGEQTLIIPPEAILSEAPRQSEALAEEIAFDKAERAEAREKEKLRIQEDIEKLEILLGEVRSEEKRGNRQERVEQIQRRIKSLEAISKRLETDSDEEALIIPRNQKGHSS